MTIVFREKVIGTGQIMTKVVGTSYRQNELSSLLPDHDGLGSVTKRCLALLVSEPTNPHDPNAIRVEIESIHVGYLDRTLASDFKIWLVANGYESIQSLCDGLIIGGFGAVWTDEGIEIEEGNYGVRLDVALPGSVVAVTELDPLAEHVFAPMRQSKIVGNVLITHIEATELEVGTTVTFWLNRHDNSFIGLYAAGGSGGSSRLGLLPDKFYNLVAPHLQAGLPVEAHIDRIENGVCFVRFRLVPREVVEQAERQMREKKRAMLLKAYKPIKPMQTMISPVSTECGPLRKGTRLVFSGIPTIDDCLSTSQMFFSTEDGSCLYGTSDQDFKCRVFRLGERRNSCEIRVVATNRTNSGNSYCIELRLLEMNKKR